MKTTKYALLVLAIGFLASCSVSKSARTQRNIISGTWILNNIDYQNNSGAFSSVLFGDAKDICFEGSQWYFRDNNSTGRYTIKQGSLCQGGDRFIRWSVIEPENSVSQLQFKFIDEKRNDVSGGYGYRLNITNITETQMTLTSNVAVDGENVTVVYEFSKQ